MYGVARVKNRYCLLCRAGASREATAFTSRCTKSSPKNISYRTKIILLSMKLKLVSAMLCVTSINSMVVKSCHWSRSVLFLAVAGWPQKLNSFLHRLYVEYTMRGIPRFPFGKKSSQRTNWLQFFLFVSHPEMSYAVWFIYIYSPMSWTAEAGLTTTQFCVIDMYVQLAVERPLLLESSGRNGI